MQLHHVTTSIESFDDNQSAEAAVHELISVGFRKSQISVISPRQKQNKDVTSENPREPGISELGSSKAYASSAPGIGPALAAGSVGESFGNFDGSRAEATLGALGVPADYAQHFEMDFDAGRTIVTVHSGTRSDIAQSVLNRFKSVLSHAR